jgi:hypothetical protein
MEYLDCKIDWSLTKKTVKITQPVLLQSLKDEFLLPNKDCDIPALAIDLLTNGDDDPTWDEASHTKY